MPVTAPAVRRDLFDSLSRCWVCGGDELEAYHRCRMDFSEYAGQDPELHAYTGEHVWLARCRKCGFGQPSRLPTLDPQVTAAFATAAARLDFVGQASGCRARV